MRRTGLLEAVLLVLLVVILAALAVPRYLHVLARAKEKQVEANAYLLQLKVEEFARETGGLYPVDFKTRVGDLNPQSPRDFSLEEVTDEAHDNPYLKGKENVFEAAPPGAVDVRGRPGLVVYIPGKAVEDSIRRYATTYRILAFGRDGERPKLELRELEPPAR